MKKSFASLTIMGLMLGGPALAADVALRAPASPMRVFTWTGCYLGGSGAAGWGRKQFPDPTEIVTGTAAVPLVTISPNGWLVGAQAGCDEQFSGNAVIGIEGAFSGGSIKGTSTVAIPFGDPGDSALVSTRLNALASVTGRLGYAVDRTLLYAKGGVAWASEQHSAIGVFQGTQFDLEVPETRFGWTVGAGLQWAFSDYWSIGLEYDYYGFGHHSVTFLDSGLDVSGPIDIKQTIQTVRLGLNFHMFARP